MKEKGNLAYDKAFDFAKNMVNLYKQLTSDKKEFVLSKQLLRSGTSIGANLSEAIGAFSKADFSYKLSISYKECLDVDENIKNKLPNSFDVIGNIILIRLNSEFFKYQKNTENSNFKNSIFQP